MRRHGIVFQQYKLCVQDSLYCSEGSAIKLCYSLHCIMSKWQCGSGAWQFFCLNKMLVVVSAGVLVVDNVL